MPRTPTVARLLRALLRRDVRRPCRPPPYSDLMAVTRGNWARDFLAFRDLEPTVHRLNAMVSWETAEGTDAKFNPLATTWDMPRDTLYNNVGVRNYHTEKDGLKATWLTLERGD